MTEYSVAIGNRFALGDLSEDEDLHELLERKQAEKKRKEELAAEAAAKAAAEAAAKAKKDKKGSGKPGSKKANVTTESKSASVTHTNSNKSFQRNDENRPPRFANRSARDGGESQNFEKPPQNDSFGGRGRRGGGGFNRGRGGFGGRGGKREFDRHSGSDKTGVKAVEKREGSGPHNWGDQIEAQMEETTPEVEPGTETTEENGTTMEQNDTQEAEPVVEEDNTPKEMTLDEWRAARQGQSKAKTDFNVRKPNEGVDQKQWKGTVALQKKKKGDIDEDDEEYIEEDVDDIDETKSALEKLNIQITFADSGRSGPRGRGRGRGGGFTPRGRGGRGGRGGFSDRRGDGKSSVPRVDNESDFPTLGSR